ncbi:MAG: hypothetical protein ACOX16_03490 [Candidatus Izemoplasmatales bacterium]|jgi:hypothetical protein
MKTKDRLIVTLHALMISVLLFWLTNILFVFALPALGFVYTLVGGKIHG